MAIAEDYLKHIYGTDTEGYIQVLQLDNGKVLRMYNTETKGLYNIVQEQEGEKDTFITPNSFYIPYRANNNIRHFRALYVDLDIKQYSKTETIYQIYILVSKEKIPEPTMIVDSGRGLHIYWRIDHAPKGAAFTWQELEDYLYLNLKPLGADIKATDSARLLRLPDTINSRNKELCKVVSTNDNKYSMYELRERYLNNRYNFKANKRTKKKPKVNYMYNSYSLHINRAYDLETLCKLRNYRVEGYRNSILHCYAYWKGIYTRDPEQLKDIVIDLNNKFSNPLKDTEVKAMLRSIPKAIKKFVEYEQGLNSGQVKRVSKGMRDKGGYWYKNETLINMLEITEEEQKHLKTIIGKSEKYKRNNDRRRQDRRNKDGLTQREQQKKDTINKIKQLREEGLTIKQVAEEVGLTVKGVEYHLYS